MTALVRSLLAMLALAALLAAAIAGDYNCVERMYGTKTPIEIPLGPFPIDYGDNPIEIIDYCSSPHTQVGTKMVVCNNSPDCPIPDIRGWPPTIDAICSCVAGCSANPTEYCL